VLGVEKRIVSQWEGASGVLRVCPCTIFNKKAGRRSRLAMAESLRLSRLEFEKNAFLYALYDLPRAIPHSYSSFKLLEAE
jgi:hypothetical protein